MQTYYQDSDLYQAGGHMQTVIFIYSPNQGKLASTCFEPESNLICLEHTVYTLICLVRGIKQNQNYNLLYHLQFYKVGKYDKNEGLNLVLSVSENIFHLKI